MPPHGGFLCEGAIDALWHFSKNAAKTAMVGYLFVSLQAQFVMLC